MSGKTCKREVRVFISSTFRDMQIERNNLVKYVFPEIRQICRERLVEFTEVDLRWGITEEESKGGEVIRVCLEEIDRCRPYFLGFMGERYGWCPSMNDISRPDALIEKFPTVATSLQEGKSVTEMEILRGVIDNPVMVERAFFYFRDKSLTDELSKQSDQSNYFDSSESDLAKLKELKSTIIRNQAIEKKKYSSIQQMCGLVKQDLMDVINKDFPEDQVPSPLEHVRIIHEGYALDRRYAYLPNPIDISALNNYVARRKRNASELPLIVGGMSGLGKSSLLAYWMENYSGENPNTFTIQHYVGVYGDATPSAILLRIIMEIKDRNGDPEALPVTHEDIVSSFPFWLAKIRANDFLLLVIDAINQVQCTNLEWLPNFLPTNACLIVSTLPGEVFDQLAARGWPQHIVQFMEKDMRLQLIQQYLGSFSKKLSRGLIENIASAAACQNPLYLVTLLEELRVSGSYEKLDERITSYLEARDPEELFIKVLGRMGLDYIDENNGSLTAPILKCIWAARKGLSESELLGITGINRKNLSFVLLALDFHLSNKNGLRGFFHDYLTQSVEKHYLSEEADKTYVHKTLAKWFEQQDISVRKVEELPWQWKKSGRLDKLESCLSSIEMFHQLFLLAPLDLLGYWRSIKADENKQSKHYSGQLYWKLLGQQSRDKSSTAKFALELGEFFLKYDVDTEIAELFLRYAINHFEDSNQSVLKMALNYLANSLIDQGYPFSTEEICRRAHEICKSEPDGVGALAVSNLARYLQYVGKEVEADHIYQSYFDSLSTTSETVETAKVSFDYSEYLYSRGNENAVGYAKRALEIRKRLLGNDDPDTAVSYQDVAVMIDDRKIKEEYFQHALEVFRRCFGNNHPETVNTLCNLSEFICEEMDDRFCADELLKDALEGWYKCKGRTNSDTPAILKEYEAQMEFSHDSYEELHDELELTIEQADAIEEHNLRQIELQTDEKKNREKELSEKIKYCEIHFGELASETGDAIDKYIKVCSEFWAINCRNVKEKEWLERLLLIRESTSDKVECFRILVNLANISTLDKSIDYFTKALALNVSIECKLDVLFKCGNALWDAGKKQRSLKMLTEEFSARQKCDGTDVEALAKSSFNLFNKLQIIRNFPQAELIGKTAMSFSENDQKKLAVIYHGLGIVLSAQGKLEEAEKYFKKEISCLSSMDDKPFDYLDQLSKAKQAIARLWYSKGNYHEAENMFCNSLNISCV